jgi:hypothetical protein
VHLGVVVEVDRCINSKRLIAISNVSRFANGSRFVDQIEAVVAAHRLRIDRLVACQKNKRKNERCNANRHLLLLLLEQSNRGERPQWGSPEGEVFEAGSQRICEFRIRRCITGTLAPAPCVLSG